MSRFTPVLAAALVWSFAVGAFAADDSRPFDEASVRFEQNATDGDVEVVFQAKAGDEGLAELQIMAPDGRTVADFRAPDASTLGIRQFVFESPEPKDVPGLKRAYPEGAYRFSAVTVSGKRFHGEARLGHALPAVVSILQPGEAPVPFYKLEITWVPVPDVAGFIVELEQEELGARLNVRLPASAQRFAVPAGFLVPGREYGLSVGSVTQEGNVSFVETSFETAEY